MRKLSGGQFRGSVSTRYGLEKEGVALQDLKLEIEGNLGEPVEVRSSGLVVNVDKPWLSATPDGVLSTSDSTFLVEIKLSLHCPRPDHCRSSGATEEFLLGGTGWSF